jgi:hypothetical protein
MNARANAQRVMQAGSMAKEGQIQEALVMYQKALDLNDKLHGPERYSSNVFILYIIIFSYYYYVMSISEYYYYVMSISEYVHCP